MGVYLNPGSDKFQTARRSEIYVDKSRMIAYLNRVIRTEDRFVCVSRPRRFGKSMAANMISAYYDRTSAAELFRGMQIEQEASFNDHYGHYDVIQINMQDFLSQTQNIDDFLKLLKKSIMWDLLEEYPTHKYFDDTDLFSL